MTSSSTPIIEPLSEKPVEKQIDKDKLRISRRIFWRLFIVSLLLSDGIMTVLAFTSAYWIRFELSVPLFRIEVIPSLQFYRSLVLALIPVWLLIFASVGLYQRLNLLGGTQEYAHVFRATTIGFMLVIVAGFLEPSLIIARGWLLLAWILTFIFTAGSRVWLRRVVYFFRRRGYFLSPALIVGANGEGPLLAEQLLSWESSGLRLVGLVDDNLAPSHKILDNLEVLGGLNRLDEIIKEHGIEELILATSALTREQMLTIFERYGVSDDINVKLSSGLFEIIATGLQIKEVAYIPLVSVNKVRLTGADTFLKTTLDLVLTIPGLILLSPFLLLIAIAIKLDSPGPVIHRRRVMGLNNIQFDAYKFRTMFVNGDKLLEEYPDLQEELAQTHKLKIDPRITRVGSFLRRFSLDELPQLYNVLKRNMSLVGPRMISPEEITMYNQWGINLLTVRPGITGLWQVSGRSDISYEERVRLDMYYIRNWTIWLDLQLLLRTIPALITRKGAY
jgi:exopolysaccharide biosynthesis polyprenyl glycosylphosphotransferase